MANWPGTVIDEKELQPITGQRVPDRPTFRRDGVTSQPVVTTPPIAPPRSSYPGDDFPGEEVDVSTSLTQYATPTLGKAELSEDGTSTFARPEDKAFAQKVQDALANGAGRTEIDALSEQYGFPKYGPELEKAIEDQKRGILWTVGVPTWGREEASALSPIANSPVGAAIGAAADVGAAGLSDEIAGIAGGDSFMDVVRGEGEAQKRAQLLKEAAGDEYPIATAAGSIAGGITGAMGAGKIAGAGRQVAADAGFGVAYGAGSNNENRLGGAALGGAAAGAGSYFGGKLLDKIANRAPREAARVVEAGQKFGIDVPMGATGRAPAIVEKGLDISPASAGVMQAGRDVLTDQVGEAVENVAQTFGPTTSYSGVGDAAQRGARAWIEKFQKVSGKAYDAIPIAPATNSDLSNTVSSLRALNTRFSSNPELASLLNNSKLAAYLDALAGKITSVPTGVLDASGNPITRQVQSGGRLSWEDLKDFRTRIGEEIGDHLFSDGTLKSELRGLYGALSEDMKATAAAQGPKALRAFERANTLYKQGQDRIDGAITKMLGNDSGKSAESAAAKIQAIARDGKASADLATLAEIRKTLPSEEWAQVQNGIIRLLGQPANSAGREFDPGVFVRTFRDMAPEARNLFFGRGALRENLDEFSDVMGSLAKNNSLRNTSNTAPAIMGSGAVTGVAAALLNPILGVKLAAGAIANYSLAKLWTNPKFVRWATGYARMVRGAAKAGGQPNTSKQLELLKKVAASEPAIAQDALGLQQYLAQQFAQSPQKLAAEEGQEPSQ